DRILYGSDFPNLPYAWDRELRNLAAMGLGDAALAAILGGNARRVLLQEKGPSDSR
ncbi:MAG: amidohydrolase family protein, partial [Cyanobacteria bacterium RYN_339]|nr:amidohydrolase family protein [Cyanobacteria bacterium RYN_339]